MGKLERLTMEALDVPHIYDNGVVEEGQRWMFLLIKEANFSFHYPLVDLNNSTANVNYITSQYRETSFCKSHKVGSDV